MILTEEYHNSALLDNNIDVAHSDAQELSCFEYHSWAALGVGVLVGFGLGVLSNSLFVIALSNIGAVSNKQPSVD